MPTPGYINKRAVRILLECLVVLVYVHIDFNYYSWLPSTRTLYILQLTSQHPYAEEFIGEPHVFTVDIHNEQELRRAMQAALKAHNMSKVGHPHPHPQYTQRAGTEVSPAGLGGTPECLNRRPLSTKRLVPEGHPLENWPSGTDLLFEGYGLLMYPLCTDILWWPPKWAIRILLEYIHR